VNFKLLLNMYIGQTIYRKKESDYIK